MSIIIVFLQKAIAQGIAILYGANGEILTEKTRVQPTLCATFAQQACIRPKMPPVLA